MERKNLLILSHAALFLVGFLVASAEIPEVDATIEGSKSASANIAATTQSGEGAIGKANVDIESGTGRVLLDTNPFIETDTQLSIKTARNIAEDVVGISLRDKNVIYSFSIDGDYVGGPSAGAAMTLATIAAIDDERAVRNDVVATGTIEEDGNIGRVGGVPEKAFAAGNSGAEVFIVPEGQETFTYYREVVERRQSPLGFVHEDVRYVPETISLNNITQERFGMETVEVRNIEEAQEIALTEE